MRTNDVKILHTHFDKLFALDLCSRLTTVPDRCMASVLPPNWCLWVVLNWKQFSNPKAVSSALSKISVWSSSKLSVLSNPGSKYDLVIWRDFFPRKTIVIFVQNVILKMWILSKMWFWKCEFCQTKFLRKCTLLWSKNQWLLWLFYLLWSLAFLQNIWLIEGILVWFLFFILA